MNFGGQTIFSVLTGPTGIRGLSMSGLYAFTQNRPHRSEPVDGNDTNHTNHTQEMRVCTWISRFRQYITISLAESYYPKGLVAQIAFEQNCLNFCSLQGEKRSKSCSFARLFNAEEGKKATCPILTIRSETRKTCFAVKQSFSRGNLSP